MLGSSSSSASLGSSVAVRAPRRHRQRRFQCSLTPSTASPPQTLRNADAVNSIVSERAKEKKTKRWNEEEEEEGKGISDIRVARQKYIPVSKADLLNAIASDIVNDQAQDFLLLSSCLDSILHAEHKSILEEMRSDYFHEPAKVNGEGSSSDTEEEGFDLAGINSVDMDEEKREIDFENPNPFNYVLDLRNFLLSSSPKTVKRVDVATRFQRAFMQLLYDAQFEELSARDLMLTSALNTDYLLTLPIYVDWKRASQSNAIIFRRGYTAERQKGLLVVEKLDYLQSKLLRGIFFIVSQPLGKLGSWMSEGFRDAFEKKEEREWTKQLKLWLKELALFQRSFQNEGAANDMLGADELSNKDLPIWLAAQRAVLRYEGLLSPVGPRGRLLRKLLAWTGLITPTPETPFEIDGDSNASEPHKRPISLSRITLADIWRPATRKYCRNDIWRMFKTSISILLSQSILQEPAFEELILLYTDEMDKGDTTSKSDIPSLQIKIYDRIPIPDLPVVFPHKKLSFRIIDTVRLDLATILGLSAYFINYRFESLFSSPSAIVLDTVAIAALILSVSRVVLGYKQTWDRYQLLVNRTLYEKTLASGFGAVHFILDASQQQQYKESILAYAILLKMEGKSCRHSIKEKCERFMYDVFKVKVEMPIDKAVDTLLRLGLATENVTDGRIGLTAVPCSDAYKALTQRWNSLLG